MSIRIETKGNFENSLKWLKDSTNFNPTQTVNAIASAGVEALKANTPKDTGETAAGWTSEVKMTAKGLEIVWKNKAHPELKVNLAKLIEFGHGTGTGGYVSPRPYVKQAIAPVFKTGGDKLAKELFK